MSREVLIRSLGGLTVLLIVAYFGYEAYRAKQDQVPYFYFTGTLLYTDFNNCGLVRTQTQDFRACRISIQRCSYLRDHVNKRVRIQAQKGDCATYPDLECSTEGEFEDKGFKPTDCFNQMTLMKVF